MSEDDIAKAIDTQSKNQKEFTDIFEKIEDVMNDTGAQQQRTTNRLVRYGWGRREFRGRPGPQPGTSQREGRTALSYRLLSPHLPWAYRRPD